MSMTSLAKYTVRIGCCALLLVACNKSKLEDVPIIPSSGNNLSLNGLVGNEDGSAAGNSVFVDFSEDGQTALKRSGWDLGFYCGNESRVIINNTTAAMAVISTKFDLDEVNADDVKDISFEVDIANPSPETFLKLDGIDGDLNKTVIPEIGTTLTPVVIIGRGVGGGTPRRSLIKVQFKWTVDGSYWVKWAPIDSNNYRTEMIGKDNRYHFRYFSFDEGVINSSYPQKRDWDIMWGASVYQTPNGNEMAAYVFSDMVMLNYLSGVQAVEKVYSSSDEAQLNYNKYALSDVYGEQFSNYRWEIGAQWRVTAAPGVLKPGVKKDRFYVVKDTDGNYYKLQFLNFSADDGGTRGRPQIEYELLR
jgi:hypothetical protein